MVAARRGVVHRGEVIGVAHIQVDFQFLDEVLRRRHPAVRDVTMPLGDAGCAVADGHRGVEGRHVGRARGHRWRSPAAADDCTGGRLVQRDVGPLVA